MVKKRVNLSIDEDVYNASKDVVANMSVCFENFLQALVNNNGDTDIASLKMQIAAEETSLNKAMSNIVILNSKLKGKIRNYENTMDYKNSMWNNFKVELSKRNFNNDLKYMDENIVRAAENALGYSKSELIKIDTFVRANYKDFNCPLDKVNEWAYIEPEWRRYND